MKGEHHSVELVVMGAHTVKDLLSIKFVRIFGDDTPWGGKCGYGLDKVDVLVVSRVDDATNRGLRSSEVLSDGVSKILATVLEITACDRLFDERVRFVGECTHHYCMRHWQFPRSWSSSETRKYFYVAWRAKSQNAGETQVRLELLLSKRKA